MERLLSLKRASSVGVLLGRTTRSPVKVTRGGSCPALPVGVPDVLLADSFDNQERTVCLHQQPEGNHGVSLMASQSGRENGVFVGAVLPNIAEARLGNIRRGQRVLTMNGISVDVLSDAEVVAMLQADGDLVLRLVYDPDGFARFDDGVEMRRASQAVFKALARSPASISFTSLDSVRYCGAAPLAQQDCSLPSIAQAFGTLQESITKDRVLKIILHVTHAEISFVSKYTEETIKHFHMCDLIKVVSNQRMLAVVVRTSSTMDSAHYLCCKSSKTAEKLKQVVIGYLRESFAQLEQRGLLKPRAS